MTTMIVSQRQIDELTILLGRKEAELAAAAQREAALEARVLEYLAMIGKLQSSLTGMGLLVAAPAWLRSNAPDVLREARALQDEALQDEAA